MNNRLIIMHTCQNRCIVHLNQRPGQYEGSGGERMENNEYTTLMCKE